MFVLNVNCIVLLFLIHMTDPNEGWSLSRSMVVLFEVILIPGMVCNIHWSGDFHRNYSTVESFWTRNLEFTSSTFLLIYDVAKLTFSLQSGRWQTMTYLVLWFCDILSSEKCISNFTETKLILILMLAFEVWQKWWHGLLMQK